MPVAANLSEIQDRLVSTVDQKLAEPVKLSFLKEEQPDPERPAVEISAVLRVGGGKASSMAPGASRAWRSKLAAGKAELHIDRSRYDGPAVKTGDRVRALARRGQPWFEVLRVDDRGDTRLVLELGEK
ncbi:hypothetical protein [Rhizobium sp. LC145]|uniref:hypothetical protein n=1 Tax=Rhizobium sp. LC145 TaxID=1120688 RepID=UPI000629E9FF|nr:hypothetical protein [Rhizobium sp. LC145]KKX24317.1 hypothetical protein YH62_27570 [Rhizobium sp. LC145]TKT46188.1 hypothetical protein FDR95_23815 [Rhizobiaceae bacterium LC148]